MLTVNKIKKRILETGLTMNQFKNYQRATSAQRKIIHNVMKEFIDVHKLPKLQLANFLNIPRDRVYSMYRGENVEKDSYHTSTEKVEKILKLAKKRGKLSQPETISKITGVSIQSTKRYIKMHLGLGSERINP